MGARVRVRVTLRIWLDLAEDQAHARGVAAPRALLVRVRVGVRLRVGA